MGKSKVCTTFYGKNRMHCNGAHGPAGATVWHPCIPGHHICRRWRFHGVHSAATPQPIARGRQLAAHQVELRIQGPPLSHLCAANSLPR